MSGRSVCLILGNRLQGIKTALQQAFPCESPTGNRQSHGPLSPLQVISILVSEYVALMEPDRQDLDIRVRELEAKTGMSAHTFDESLRAAADEHNTLLKELHVCEGQLGFYERTQKFQVGLIEWLQAQHATLNHFRFGTHELHGITPADRPVEEIVRASFGLGASLSRERLEQVYSLRNRIRVQLNVVRQKRRSTFVKCPKIPD